MNNKFEEKITFDLELNKDVMDVILSNYKKAYVMKNMYDTPEYKHMYDNAVSNIDKEMVSLEKITNSLLMKIDEQQKTIDADNTIINTLKNDVKNLVKEDKIVKNSSLASQPRYKASSVQYKQDNYYIGVQILGILILGYTFYKTYKYQQ